MKKQKIEIAVVPIPPVITTGKQFNLRFSSVQDVLEFLTQEQPFEVLIYIDGAKQEIVGKDNKEKGENLKKFLQKK